MAELLLNVQNLTTSFYIEGVDYPAVDNVGLQVYKNEVMAIVGESGSGKSALALSIAGLHAHNTKLSGVIDFLGVDMLSLSQKEINRIRGKELGFIFQEPLTALNPLMTVGQQIAESLSYHTSFSSQMRKQKALELLAQVGIHNPKMSYYQYPHELSGGMRQRVVIAIAIACEPALVIADEPTTSLDVTIEAAIIDLLLELQARNGMSILLITHNLSIVAQIAHRVAVMYAGQILEIGSVTDIFNQPLHPYTRSLLASVQSLHQGNKRLYTMYGMVESLPNQKRTGCRFAPRIPWLDAQCHETSPQLLEVSDGHWVRCSCYKHFDLDRKPEECV